MRYNRMILVALVAALMSCTVAQTQSDTNQIMGKLGYVVGTELTVEGIAAQILVRQMKLKMPPDGIIFRQDNGQPYSAGNFRSRLHRLCTKAKVPKRPPYALRHTFATNLAGDGTNMTIIGQLMGHSTLRTTQRYIANNFECQQTAIDRLADRFSTLADDKMTTKVVPAEKAFDAVEAPACVTACRKTG